MGRLLHTPTGFFVASFSSAGTLPEALAYGAGLTKLGFAPFALISTATGVIPTAVLAWLGDAGFSASH